LKIFNIQFSIFSNHNRMFRYFKPLTQLATIFLTVSLVGPLFAADRPDIQPGRASHTFDIRNFQSASEEPELNTGAINRAIEACAATGGGQVLIPAGRWVSGTIHLKSHVTLYLAPGATLVGTTNLSLYSRPSVPSFMPEAKWGNWHRALLVGDGVEDVTVCGEGVIDGHKVFDPNGEEHMRGPHSIIFVNCRRFTIRDISIVDAANYAIFFQASDDVDIRNVRITGGWDGVHFRGGPERWCHNVNIVDCQFYTGDDSIAGRYWDNTIISRCIINSSCNGIRLIGPATRLVVDQCLFYGPGQQPHRTGGRTNMLSGIILQPGAWDKTKGLLDDVLLSQNTMHDVASPVTIWTKPGNPVGRITVAGLNATAVYRSALSVESWSEIPITNVVVRNASIEFLGGGTAEQAAQIVKGPGVDARPLPAWGLYARNVDQLTLEDVRLSLANEDFRPAVFVQDARHIVLDTFKFPQVAGVSQPIATTNVLRLDRR
jgi:Glycosyl hydrolases family 28